MMNIEKHVEGSSHGVICGTLIMTFAWRDKRITINLGHDSWYPSQDSNTRHPEHEAEVLTTQTQW
jgi:hypothetical protein